MNPNLSRIIEETCIIECKGNCCAHGEQLTPFVMDGFITLTEGIIIDPVFKEVLIERLEQEKEAISGQNKFMSYNNFLRYKMRPNVVAERIAAIDRLTSFLGSQDFSPEDVHELSDAIKEFAESPNRRDKPHKYGDYCSFNMPSGCMISEYNERVCRTYICYDNSTGNYKSKGVFLKLVKAGCKESDYIALLTKQVSQENLLKILEVDLNRGRPYRHVKVIFDGEDLEQQILELVEGMGKIVELAPNKDKGHYIDETVEVRIFRGDISEEEGYHKFSSMAFSYLSEKNYLTIFLARNSKDQIYPNRFGYQGWHGLASCAFMEIAR